MYGPRHGAGKDLAEFLGASPNVITNWENGSNHSYGKYVKQLASYFGVTVDYLLTGEQKEKLAEKFLDELIKVEPSAFIPKNSPNAIFNRCIVYF